MSICIWNAPISNACCTTRWMRCAQHGYRRIWLLGISLGGSGAMICATQRTPEIEGVFLLAPFLGTRGLIAEVEAAGGLQHWQAGEITPRPRARPARADSTAAQLETDGFPAHLSRLRQRRPLSRREHHAVGTLPPHRVTVMPGGHDWETWQRCGTGCWTSNPSGGEGCLLRGIGPCAYLNSRSSFGVSSWLPCG